MRKLRVALPPIFAAITLICMWELVIRLLEVPVYVFPAPMEIWHFVQSADEPAQSRWSLLLGAGGRTLAATALGFTVAVILGLLSGTVLALNDGLRRGVYPLANLLQMVPVIALAPLLNIWFGHGISGVSASAAIVAIFPMIANTVDGLRGGDPKLQELFTVYNASRWQRWRYLDFPGALPNIFTGMKIAAGLAVIGAVVGELVSGVINHPPIGALIAQGLRNSNLPLVFGAVLTSALIGFLLFALVVFCEALTVSSWHGIAASTRIAGTHRKTQFVPKLLGLFFLTILAGSLPSQREVLKKTKSKVEASSDAKEVSDLKIQLNWFPDPQFGGFYAAEMLGYYEQAGLDVTLIQGGPGVATPQMVATGEVEFAVVGGDQIMTNRAQGAPIVAVYAAYNTYPRAFMVHESAPYRSLEELWQSDAKIAVEPGLPFVQWMQEKYDSSALTLIPSGGGLASFQRDLTLAQAVFVTSEPVTMKKRGIPVKIFPVAQSGYNPYTVVLATNERFLRQHPRVAVKVVSAVRKGWAAYLADPEPINRRMAKLNADMTVETMNIGAEISETYVRPPHPLRLGEMTTARWQSLGSQLQRVGAISGEVPSPDSCFSNVGLSHLEGADVQHE